MTKERKENEREQKKKRSGGKTIRRTRQTYSDVRIQVTLEKNRTRATAGSFNYSNLAQLFAFVRRIPKPKPDQK